MEKPSNYITVGISQQKLCLFSAGQVIKTFQISTSKYGAGNKTGSNKTPLGLHQIVRKIGKNAPLGAFFFYTYH